MGRENGLKKEILDKAVSLGVKTSEKSIELFSFIFWGEPKLPLDIIEEKEAE